MVNVLAELPQLDEHDRKTAELMLARARAEGRLEALNGVHADVHMALADDTEKDRGHVNKWGLSKALGILETAIVTAERELAKKKGDAHG